MKNNAVKKKIVNTTTVICALFFFVAAGLVITQSLRRSNQNITLSDSDRADNLSPQIQAQKPVDHPIPLATTKTFNGDASTAVPEDFPSELEAFVTQWFEQIRQSDRHGDLLLAALFIKQDPIEKETFLTRAFEHMPENILLNYTIADFCGYHPHASLCALVDINALIELDSDNGFMRTTLANQAYRDGDIDGALAHLQKAQGLTRFDSQTLTQLSLIDESLTHHGGPRNLALLETATGIHAALVMPSHYLQIPQMCHEQTHSAWRDTCQSLGHMMHKQMRDPFEMMMGLKLLGEMDLHLERPLPNAELARSLSAGDTPDSLQDLFNDPASRQLPISDALWLEYLQVYDTQGPRLASIYLHDQLRLIED